jgi:hypothetical protein
MALLESNSLLRVLKSSREIVPAFSKFCTQRGVTVRGARICTGPRGLRGLSAKADLPAGSTVVRVPAKAMVHVGLAIHDATFREAVHCNSGLSLSPLFDQLDALFPLRCRGVPSASLPQDSLTLRNHQILLAGYLAYAAVTNGHPLQAYTDFLPRSEGFFGPLIPQWFDALDDSEWCAALQHAIARPVGHASAEARPLILWALSMMASRQLPLQDPDWKMRALHAGDSSSGSPMLSGQCEEGGLSTIEILSLDAKAIRDTLPPAATLASTVSTLPVLCPILDLCNHSATVQNVELDVETDDVGDIAFKLVTTTDVAAGAELTMNYGATDEELRFMWGMSTVL